MFETKVMNADSSSSVDKATFKTGKAFADAMGFEPNMLIQLFDKDGNLKDERHAHNLVTTHGKNAIADQILAAPSLVKIGWMAIGTGSPAATLLGAENARVAFDSKLRGTNVVTVVATFPAGIGTGAITEAGTFDVVTANTVNMWMSASFGVITKGAGDGLVISWTLTIN